YVFYLEIANDIIQSIVYISFFIAIFYKYGIPIHLIRDIYITVQRVFKRMMDFYNYRKNIRNLRMYSFYILILINFRIPDASPEELVDKECVICWGSMQQAKKLYCGHLFHGTPCLRNWLETSKECPLCRAPIDRDEYMEYIREQHGEESNNDQPISPQQPNLQQPNLQQPNIEQTQLQQPQQTHQQPILHTDLQANLQQLSQTPNIPPPLQFYGYPQFMYNPYYFGESSSDQRER